MTTISRITVCWSPAALQHNIDQPSGIMTSCYTTSMSYQTNNLFSTHCSSDTLGISTNRNHQSPNPATIPPAPKSSSSPLLNNSEQRTIMPIQTSFDPPQANSTSVPAVTSIEQWNRYIEKLICPKILYRLSSPDLRRPPHRMYDQQTSDARPEPDVLARKTRRDVAAQPERTQA